MTVFTYITPIQGQLPNAQGTVLTPAVGSTYITKSFALFNNNAAAQTVNIWLKTGATITQLKRYILQQYDWVDIGSLIVPDGSVIQAATTTAAAVDFSITGIKAV